MTVSYFTKRLALLLLLVAATLQLQAQDKQLTMEDAIINPTLLPENMQQLRWVAGTDDFTYIRENNGTKALVRGSATSKNQRDILTLQQLSAAVEAVGADKLNSFPVLHWRDANTFVINAQNSIFQYDLKSGKATVVTTYAETADYTELDPTMQRVAYTNGNNLFVSEIGRAHV